MNWKRLLTSPPPTTCWSLDGDVIAAVRREAKGPTTCASAALPARTVEVGPIGLQSVDKELLGKALAAVQTSLQGARRPALVIPTAWVRCHLLGFDELPRRRSDMDDVLRWRLKRLLPVPPGEMRVSWVPAGTRKEKKFVLCMTGIGRALNTLEQVFTAHGLAPGLIAPRILVLVHGQAGDSAQRLIIQQERGFLSLAMTSGNAITMLRTKPMPPAVGEDKAVESELRLSWTYIRESLEIRDQIRVRIIAESAAVSESLHSWFGERDGVMIENEMLTPPLPSSGEGIDAASYAPIHSVLNRGIA